MQLNLSTDYAIRAMLHLAQTPKGCSAREVGEAAGIERIHAQKILRQLKQNELVTSQMGNTGGFMLARPAEEITLLDVVEAMEKTMRINRCIEDDHFCNLNRAGVCPVHAVYQGLQDMIERYLSSYTLKSLLDDPPKGVCWGLKCPCTHENQPEK